MLNNFEAPAGSATVGKVQLPVLSFLTRDAAG